VIAVDTNILVYAHRRELIPHSAAAAKLKELAESTAAWCIPWPCVHEFIGVVTNKRIHDLPTPLPMAFAQIARWADSPSFQYLGESPEHLEILREVAITGSISGGMIHDARIAAICIDHGVSELWSADRDFSRFPQIKVKNPLIG
jgi:uncharacterized protein